MNECTNAETVGTSTDPSTIASACVDATCPAIGVKSVASAGNTFEYTVLTPAAVRMLCASGICGAVNGSSTVAYAAVFGRWLAGNDATHCAQVTRLSLTGTETSKTLCSPCVNTAGAPPAPSMNAYPYLAATLAEGAVSSVENGPNTSGTLSEPISFW